MTDITQTKLFEEAAAAAREASQRYWVRPGHKCYPMPWWPLSPPSAVDTGAHMRKPGRRMADATVTP
jgi:hypothetical protein